MDSKRFEPTRNAEPLQELPLGVCPSLIEWPSLKRSLLEVLGEERWPDTLSVYDRAESGHELTNAIAEEGVAFGSIGFEDLADHLEGSGSLQGRLDFYKRKLAETNPSDGLYAFRERMVAETGALIELLDQLLRKHQKGVILFSVTTTEIPLVLMLLKKLPKSQARYALLVNDPPHLWQKIADENQQVLFLEAEKRTGVELVSSEQRERAEQYALDLLSPLASYGVPDNGLVRALRQMTVPTADIDIERRILRTVGQTGSDRSAFEEWQATQAEREERWKQSDREHRVMSAGVIEAYLRPQEGVKEQFGRYPEVYAETVLRLVALDPDCLPAQSLERAKTLFEASVYPVLDQLEEAMADGVREPAGVRSVLMRKADQVLLHPLVNDVLKRLLEFRAKLCVEGYEKLKEARSPELLREVQLRVARAAQAGSEVTSYLERLARVNTGLAPIVPVEIVPRRDVSLDLDERILRAGLAADAAEVVRLLAEKDVELHPQRQKPTIIRAELFSEMTISMSIVIQTQENDLLDQEVARLNRELTRRLSGIPKPSGQRIEQIKKELFKQWRDSWLEALTPKESK